ncbi:hypothetical protein CBM2586_A10304 [Cupriavidus phytorum]|uniref:Uncharacterized protein n=1 Tax=Cupriavidus taiwanensis TaxID=164546 RepID=A0A975ZVM2_9BURK|nr:hypothetical protein CBM2586_A10304 [Cupriavidus taiwanensis]
MSLGHSSNKLNDPRIRFSEQECSLVDDPTLVLIRNANTLAEELRYVTCRLLNEPVSSLKILGNRGSYKSKGYPSFLRSTLSTNFKKDGNFLLKSQNRWYHPWGSFPTDSLECHPSHHFDRIFSIRLISCLRLAAYSVS